jgi:hypothetical protein
VVTRRHVLSLSTVVLFAGTTRVFSQTVMTSCSGLTNQDCASQVIEAINSAASVEEAVKAWGIWSVVYENAYRSWADAPVQPNDLERMEDFVRDKINDFTNPAQMALDALIKQYFPLIASMGEFASGPVGTALMALLVPSPTQSPLDELGALNENVSSAIKLRLAPVLRSDWRDDYDSYIVGAENSINLGHKP